MAVVAEGQRQRIYLPATEEHVSAATLPRPEEVPEAELPKEALGFRVQAYGMTRWADLFTNRQLASLTTFSDLVIEARAKVAADARELDEARSEDYSGAVSTYLGFVVSKVADRGSSICSWVVQRESNRNTFARQAMPMSWDYVEMNPLLGGTGSFAGSAAWTVESLDSVSVRDGSRASQADALQGSDLQGAVVATDPPYYDNIGYADLSDFFYVWLRRSLSSVYPDLLGTMLTPKSDELIATPYRFGGKVQAEQHFEEGFIRTFTRIRESHPHQVPIIVFYAFKQEERNDAGVTSTGWETMLNGLAEAGLSVSATWPIATERASRSVDLGTNALASSIVLACRPRPASAEATTRRGFLQALKGELPRALREMQQGSIAPVDLAQAAIGPGMAVFTRYRSVLEADGSAMTVRTALALINAALDEVLFEQEGDFDPDTRFCVKWFTLFGWDEQVYGRALDLSLSTNTSVEGLVRGGIFWARAGRARLLPPDQLSKGWDPVTDERVSVWEVVVRLATVLADSGGQEAARLMALAGQRVDLDAAKELAYLLFHSPASVG